MNGKVQDGDGTISKGGTKMAERIISAEEKRWRAESDARIIAQYLEIMQDKNRVAEASKVAEVEVEELTKRLNAMKKVAKKKGGK